MKIKKPGGDRRVGTTFAGFMNCPCGMFSLPCMCHAENGSFSPHFFP